MFANLPDGRVRVNWIRDGMAGVTYVSGQGKGTSQVLTEEEIRPYLESPPAPTTHQRSLQELSLEELKERLAKLREQRLPQPQLKRMQKQQAEPKSSVRDILMSLRPDERKLLEQLLKARAQGGGTNG